MSEDTCHRCGTPASPDAKYCEQCGAQLQAEAGPSQVPSYSPPPTYQAPSYAAEMPYEGVALRFVAVLIDVTIIFVVTRIFLRFSAMFSLLVLLLYAIILEGAYGQTVGKMAVKIKVVREDGTKIDFADAAVRNILRLIDLIPYFVPYLLGAILVWTSDAKQRLGDRVAHTVVVKV